MPQITLSQWNVPVDIIGDETIMWQHKTAFYCSRKFPAGAVLPAFDWAKEMREAGKCVISGFHSAIEKDVLEILLRGEQPIILALARSLPRRLAPPIKEAINQNRLLIATPFPSSVKRPTTATARRRNEFMLTVADEIVVAHAKKEGILAPLLAQTKKPVAYLGQGRPQNILKTPEN